MKKARTFYEWLKQNSVLTISPSKELDNKIYLMAKVKMSPIKPTGVSSKWKLTGMTVLASFVILFVVTVKLNRQREMDRMVFSESPEMILEYNSIELMADTSTLTEDDWNKIESSK